MFYPILKRRNNYDKKNDGTYYRYSFYRDAILEDCQERCVYCDLLLKEHAYEGMHLDHFRPQSFFKSLSNDPHNLVISCPKCNVLKSNHWPCDKTQDNSPSHDDDVGFIDPFSERLSDYLYVDSDGVVKSKKKTAKYMIELLKLNRKARVLLRKKRMQYHISIKLKESLDRQMNNLFDEMVDGVISKELASAKYCKLKQASDKIHDLLKLL